jgi:hypothetical protein
MEMQPILASEYGTRTLVCISKMIMTLAGREAGGLSAEARGEAYMAALEDVPYWAVEEAARSWYRGECGAGYDYRWMPAPSDLRWIARTHEMAVKRRIDELSGLVNAEPLIEFSDEHTSKMRSLLGSLKLQVGDERIAPKNDEAAA